MEDDITAQKNALQQTTEGSRVETVIPSRRQWSHGLVVSLTNARPEGRHFYSQPGCSSLTDWRIEQIYVVISKVKEMLMGHADGLSEKRSLRDQLLPDPQSELEDEDDDDEAASTSEEILYTASFEELARNSIQYDTIIWFSISLLLVLAWGVGLVMLLYLPFRRYVLQKDISSRKLYVTQSHVVYKISRPSFIPFWGVITIEKQVPLSMVIDIIIEQGWLQSLYGIHTFRIESIARGKTTPVDELRVQGVANPGLLRKVIIAEASKVMQDVGIHRNPAPLAEEGETFSHMGSPTERPLIFKSPSKSLKMSGSPRYSPMDLRGIIPENLVLNKLEEVNRSVKKIESLVEKSQPSPKSKAARQLKFGH